MKLYVKNITRKSNDTLYTFLYRVLDLDENKFGKCCVNSTYYDPEFTKIQCSGYKRRSFDEIVLISKTYFKVSDKAVAKVIKRLLDLNNDIGFVLCDNIKKWVIYERLNKSNSIKYCFKYDNSDFKTNQNGKGVYSFENIINLMGLTMEDVKINN